MRLKQIPLEVINGWSRNTLMAHLAIECVAVGDDSIVARMPVDQRTHQPMGLLHGGASMALIESIGSICKPSNRSVSKSTPTMGARSPPVSCVAPAGWCMPANARICGRSTSTRKPPANWSVPDV